MTPRQRKRGRFPLYPAQPKHVPVFRNPYPPDCVIFIIKMEDRDPMAWVDQYRVTDEAAHEAWADFKHLAVTRKPNGSQYVRKVIDYGDGRTL